MLALNPGLEGLGWRIHSKPNQSKHVSAKLWVIIMVGGKKLLKLRQTLYELFVRRLYRWFKL
jgi:hypothetical protein